MARGGESIYAQVHKWDERNPFSHRNWKRANPSLDSMLVLREQIEREAARAKTDPMLLPAFVSLRLNGGVSDVAENMLLSARTWESIEGEAAAVGPYYLGVDLGGSAAMTDLAAYWPESGRLECFGVFPAEPSLEARGVADAVGTAHVEMGLRGELETIGRFTVSVPGALQAALER